MRSTIPPSPPEQYIISNPVRATKKAMRVTVFLDDQLWMELNLQPEEYSGRSALSRSTRALIELEIPGAVGPLPSPPADAGQTLWGINHGAALDNFPQHGLQLYIPAWQQMNTGDSVAVRLDGKTVQTETITALEVGQRVTTFVEARHLTQAPFRHTLEYIVTRLGQTPDPSAPTDILVELDRPGGQDQNGSIPGHSELTFFLPDDVINNGVGKEHLEAGVKVTINPYPNMAALDMIKLSWGGRFITHIVTEAEVGQPIVLTVTKEDILAAGDSGPNGLAVTYELYDLVDNRSEDWAAETRIVVDAGNSRLSGPIIKEAVNNVLDLDTLGTQPATAQIIAMSKNGVLSTELVTQFKALTTPQSLGSETLESLTVFADFNLGDKIVVTMRGTTTEGTDVTYTAPEVIVNNLPAIYEVPIPNAEVRKLAKTQAIFSYQVNHDAGEESRSRGSFVSIIGEATRLPAPVAKDASQGAIDPELATTQIEVAWDDSMIAGDVVTLRWLGTRPDASIYDPDLPLIFISNGDVIARQPLIFNVNGTHLKAIEGGKLQLYYILEQQANDAIIHRESERTTELAVGAPRNELPAPDVANVVDGALDPDLANTTLTVPNYKDKALGDQISILWKGSVSGPHTNSMPVNSRNLTLPIPFTIPGSAIKPNDKGSVSASYEVLRAGGARTSYSDINRFDVGVVALDPPTIASIMDSEGNEIEANGTTFDTSVTVTGTASPMQTVGVFDGTTLKDTSIADNSGNWTLTITGLSVAAHDIKAVAQYGDNPESAVRTFTVAAADTPTIASIKDSKGVEIPANATTFDTSVTVTGTASPNQTVEVLDGAAPKGRPQADASGNWTLNLTGLSVAAHAIKAVAQYSDKPESAVRTFTVAAADTPTIASIKDPKGVEIPANGTTFDTSVTVTGTASPNQTVEVLDGSAPKGRPQADASGNWTLNLTGLSVAAHAIKAVAQYGDKPESAVRTFTVAAAATPTIASIKDPKGIEIPANGTTFDTSVTVTGTASPMQTVEVFDGTTLKGRFQADASGNWTSNLSGLSVAAHAIKAVAQYGSYPASAVRNFTVIAVTAVAITDVKDSTGASIPNGGTTTDTSVTLSGTVTYSS